MTEAIKNLINEHRIISQKLQDTNELFADVSEGKKNSSEIIDNIEFFKKYADQLHHHKEEEILFPAMIKKNEMAGQGIIAEMLENHEDFRKMLSEINTQVQENNIEAAYEKFRVYHEALLDHIAVEDDEVFHMAETLLSEEELENIFFKFKDIEVEQKTEY
jgi:hemerythrin-like domain-containing protein